MTKPSGRDTEDNQKNGIDCGRDLSVEKSIRKEGKYNKMNQELHRLLERLSSEIFHEENYNAIPSMERIKAAMAAVNKFVGKSNLTSSSSREADTYEKRRYKDYELEQRWPYVRGR